MSYCRFSENSDVYVYFSIYNNIECCMCSISKLEKSIFTDGYEKFKISPCDCDGKGCDKCMMPSNCDFVKYSDIIDHLYEHRKQGDKVPERVFEVLKTEKKMFFNSVKFASLMLNYIFIWKLYHKLWKIFGVFFIVNS
jgi:hypothetical protein